MRLRVAQFRKQTPVGRRSFTEYAIGPNSSFPTLVFSTPQGFPRLFTHPAFSAPQYCVLSAARDLLRLCISVTQTFYRRPPLTPCFSSICHLLTHHPDAQQNANTKTILLHFATNCNYFAKFLRYICQKYRYFGENLLICTRSVGYIRKSNCQPGGIGERSWEQRNQRESCGGC